MRYAARTSAPCQVARPLDNDLFQDPSTQAAANRARWNKFQIVEDVLWSYIPCPPAIYDIPLKMDMSYSHVQ